MGYINGVFFWGGEIHPLIRSLPADIRRSGFVLKNCLEVLQDFGAIQEVPAPMQGKVKRDCVSMAKRDAWISLDLVGLG